MTQIPFWPVKPVRGGRPNDRLYQTLEKDERWVCQAKLNGKRAIWDGSILWSRLGNRIEHPVERTLPVGVSIDGEFLNDTFFAFDLPDESGSLQERWPKLVDLVTSIDHPMVKLCPTEVQWKDVEANQWEGVVFKKRASLYPKARHDGKETNDWVKYRAEWA